MAWDHRWAATGSPEWPSDQAAPPEHGGSDARRREPSRHSFLRSEGCGPAAERIPDPQAMRAGPVQLGPMIDRF